MGYRNKTYVIFDGDNDMWAYAYMLGWKKNENIDFDFHNAHEIKKMPRATEEKYVKDNLKERLNNTKQAVLLCGNSTKNLYRFVRWELEQCLNLGIPIVVANLNGARSLDADRCPPLLFGKGCIHVAYGAKIIKYALDHYAEDPKEYKSEKNWYYSDEIYKSLGYE